MDANNQTIIEKSAAKHQPRIPLWSKILNARNLTPIPPQDGESQLHSRTIRLYDTKDYEIIIVNLASKNIDSVQANQTRPLSASFVDAVLNEKNIQLHPNEHTSMLTDKKFLLNTSLASVLSAKQSSKLSSLLNNVLVHDKKKHHFNSSFTLVTPKRKWDFSRTPVQIREFIESAKDLPQLTSSCPVVNSKKEIIQYRKAKDKCPTVIQRICTKLDNSMQALL